MPGRPDGTSFPSNDETSFSSFPTTIDADTQTIQPTNLDSTVPSFEESSVTKLGSEGFPTTAPTIEIPTTQPSEETASLGPAVGFPTTSPTIEAATTQPTEETASFGPAFIEAPSCTDVVIDFESLPNGLKILGGTYLWNEYSRDYGVTLSTSGGFLTFPRLFNTSVANDTEFDDGHLGSPNENCDPAGPGVGVGGDPGAQGANCDRQGNVLIIQDNNDNRIRPRDSKTGGVISFSFDSRVKSVNEIGLMSINKNGTTVKVAYVTSTGKKVPKVIDVNERGKNSIQTIPIDRERVFNLDVNLAGQGAVTFISLCVNLTS